MKKILILVFVLLSAMGYSQTYTKVSSPTAYRQLMADSTMHVPTGATPSLRGGNNRPGALFLKISGADTVLLQWTGANWKELDYARVQRVLDSLAAMQIRLNLKADKATTITAQSPLTGGGDLSANRTIGADTGRATSQLVTGGSLNKVKDSVTTAVAAGYAPLSRQINTQAPLLGGGDLSANRTHSIDTGRGTSQISTGGDLNKVRDSLQANINSKEPTVSSGTTSQYYRGDKSWQTLDKSAVGLGNVPNTDATNPANISQTSSYRFVTDAEKSTWNGKQNALGFTPENVANKATDFTTVNNTLYPTVQAVNTFIQSALSYVVKDMGNYDASGNVFPSSGGSGSGGAIKKGDLFYISVAGTLGGQAVTNGDWIRALVDAPGQTAGNWGIAEGNFGFTPENNANKSTNTSLGTSNTLYPTQNAVKVYVDNAISGIGIGGYTPTSRTITINGTTYDLTANRTWSVGTVTSVGISVPTGFSASGSPVTSSGTLAISMAAGYSIPTDASQSNWNTAYNKRLSSASLSTSTLTLTLADATTVTASVPTWNQNTTGNAATASSVAWSGVTSKPTTLSGYGITDAIQNQNSSAQSANIWISGNITANAAKLGGTSTYSSGGYSALVLNSSTGWVEKADFMALSGIGQFGAARIGTWSIGSNWARFGHSSHDNNGYYGFMQNSSGDISINGQTVYIGGAPIQLDGNFRAYTDNVYDIGTSSNYRFRDLYLSGTATLGGNLFANSGTVSGSTVRVYGTGSDLWDFNTSGNVLSISNYNGSSWNQSASLTRTGTLSLGGGLVIPATGGIYLDGGGDTYITESSSNTAAIVAGGTTAATFTSSGVSTSGSVTASGGGFNSDLTLKKILEYSPKISIADRVQLIKYEWKDKKAFGSNQKYGYGAQWVNELLPEAVYKNESTGKLAVDYTMVHSVMLDELTRRIQSLEKRLAKYEKRN